MSMYLTDEMLAQAAKNVGETMLASLPDPEEYYHEFLPDFGQRMERLIRRTEKKRHIHQCLLRVAAAVLALVVGLSAWMAVDTKARAAVVEWIRTIYEDSIVYEFFHPSADRNEVSYRLGWVPDGYTLVQKVGEGIYTAVYQKNTEVIYFSYSRPDNRGQAEFFPENSETEPMTVLGDTGEFYTATDDSETNELVWFDDESGILFTLSSFLDKGVMLEMAESVVAE